MSNSVIRANEDWKEVELYDFTEESLNKRSTMNTIDVSSNGRNSNGSFASKGRERNHAVFKHKNMQIACYPALCRPKETSRNVVYIFPFDRPVPRFIFNLTGPEMSRNAKKIDITVITNTRVDSGTDVFLAVSTNSAVVAAKHVASRFDCKSNYNDKDQSRESIDCCVGIRKLTWTGRMERKFLEKGLPLPRYDELSTTNNCAQTLNYNVLKMSLRDKNMLNNLLSESMNDKDIVIDLEPCPVYRIEDTRQNETASKDVKIDIDSCPMYDEVINKEQEWFEINQVFVYSNDSSPEPPEYNSLINLLLEDSPPDYESVTGIHINLEEVHQNIEVKSTGRNTMQDQTRTLKDIHISKRSLIIIFVLLTFSFITFVLIYFLK